jgi:hypothetical protein
VTALSHPRFPFETLTEACGRDLDRLRFFLDFWRPLVAFSLAGGFFFSAKTSSRMASRRFWWG